MCPGYKVYYNKFWASVEKSHNKLFEKIFGRPISHTNNYLEADILCDSERNADLSLIDKKKWLYTFFVTYENNFGDKGGVIHKYNCVLSGFSSSKNCVKFPYFIERVLENGMNNSIMTIIPGKNICAVIGNSRGNMRNYFLNELDKQMRVDYGGKFKNNIGFKVGGNHGSKEIIDFYKQYKFVVAMENSIGDFYITEKIYNVLNAGVVPIYWGSPNIGKYFNVKRFICLNNESSAEISRVINLIKSMTDEDYIKMVNEPIFAKPFDEILNDSVCEIQSLLKI
jgi:hypothetical protein